MKRIVSITLILGFLCLLVLSCAGTKQMASNRPGWIDKGTGFFAGDNGKAFYGVGAATNISNVSLRRKASDAQARAQLAATFKTQIEDLTKIFAKSTSEGGAQVQMSEEQFVQATTRAFTKFDLTGAVIIDRFYDNVEKTQYSLSVLDMSLFKSKLKEMKELSEEVKNAIEKNAEKAFEELDKKSEKEK
ncbi:hypothetical protein ACFL4T_07770 [candidate division KSB1 bacterium]